MCPKLFLFRYFQLVVTAAVTHPMAGLVPHAVEDTVTLGKLLTSIEVVDIPLVVSIPQLGTFAAFCLLAHVSS